MNRISKSKITVIIILSAMLCVGLIAGLVWGKYSQEWQQVFQLLISPLINDEIEDPTDRYYFRSNELLAQSENTAYTVNGTSTWFTVANALDSSTFSKIDINYTLTWFVSENGTDWIYYDSKTAVFESVNGYQVENYEVKPITIDDVTYDTVKVTASTSSFRQEDLSAVYTFIYTEPTIEITYSSGVITVTLDTNDFADRFTFTWASGITPDNSDPNRIFSSASDSESTLTTEEPLSKNTGYTFVFFVTDVDLLAKLENNTVAADDVVSVTVAVTE